MKTTHLLALLLSTGICNAQWYTETLYDHYGQTFKIDEILFEEKTDHQHLIIFNNKQFGNVLALDGIIQTTQLDEFVYHEMITHVPILAHGNVKKVLIIGGGDGGCLREVLRHNTVEKVVMVEIDPAVIDMAKQYFPAHSNGAFENPRAHIVIDDGCKFVKESQEKFDVIICDSTDPIGPGEKLFTAEFYRDCHNLLTKHGIFVCQNGVPFMQPHELHETNTNLQQSFKNVSFYGAIVPTYIGGFMTLGWATDNPHARNISPEELSNRLKNVTGDMNYYTPALHNACFALPKFIENILND